MRLTRRVAVGIAVVCGALAALLSIIYLRGLQSGPPEPATPQTTEVVVPRLDIPPQTIITEDMLTVVSVNVNEAPKLPVTSPASISGYVAVAKLPAQQPISRDQVMQRGAAFGLSGIVPAGMRAVTVEVDPVVGVAGLLKAGDRVDVIATFEVGDELLASTILQDVKLLALGSQTTAATAAQQRRTAASQAAEGGSQGEQQPEGSDRARAETYPNATFAVTPEDAQKLILADSRGKLRLALRPVGETDFVPVPNQDIAAVAGPEYVALRAAQKKPEEKPKEEQKPAQQQPPFMMQPMAPSAPPAQPREPKKPEVEIIRGDRTTKVVP